MIILITKQLLCILSKSLEKNILRTSILTSCKTASNAIKKFKIKLVSAVLIAFLQLALLIASWMMNLN
jgi:hypothetical protein